MLQPTAQYGQMEGTTRVRAIFQLSGTVASRTRWGASPSDTTLPSAPPVVARLERRRNWRRDIWGVSTECTWEDVSRTRAGGACVRLSFEDYRRYPAVGTAVIADTMALSTGISYVGSAV